MIYKSQSSSMVDDCPNAVTECLDSWQVQESCVQGSSMLSAKRILAKVSAHQTSFNLEWKQFDWLWQIDKPIAKAIIFITHCTHYKCFSIAIRMIVTECSHSWQVQGSSVQGSSMLSAKRILAMVSAHQTSFNLEWKQCDRSLSWRLQQNQEALIDPCDFF